MHLTIIFILEAVPAWFGGDPAGFGRALYKLRRHCIRTADACEPAGADHRLWLCLAASYPLMCSHSELWEDERGEPVLAEDWTEAFGENGRFLQQVSDGYSYDLHHHRLTEIVSLDTSPLGHCECLHLIHWGAPPPNKHTRHTR